MNHSRFRRALVGLAAACMAAPAAAQQRQLPELRWQAPAGCPQTSGMRERIRTIAGPASLRESRLQVEGEITRQEDGRFQLKLVLRDGDLLGQRNIASDSCEDLAGAAAVAIGLLLSSETPLTEAQLRGGPTTDGAGAGAGAPVGSGSLPAGAAGAEPSRPGDATKAGAPPGSDPPRAESNEEREPRAPRSTASPRRWQVLLRAPVVGADFGPLPKPSLGLSLGVGAGYEQWRFVAGVGMWLDQTVYGTDLPSHGATVSRRTATLLVSRGFRVGAFELGPSVTLALERFTARGVGPGVSPREQTASWLSAGAGGFGALALGHSAALVAEIGGRIETSRPTLAIDGLGDVRQLGPVTLTTAVAAEWSF